MVLVSQGLDHVMRPLAQHLGVKWMIANRLDFRDGIATGRLLDPVIRPRGSVAGITAPDPMAGARERLVRDLGLANPQAAGSRRLFRPHVRTPVLERPIVHFDGDPSDAARFRCARRWPGSTSC